MSSIVAIIFAILIFSILIFVHELGHFLAAKLSGGLLAGIIAMIATRGPETT